MKNKVLYILTAVFAVSLLFLRVNPVAAEQDIEKINVILSYGEMRWEYSYPDIYYRGGLDREIEKKFDKDFRGRLIKQRAPLSCAYGLLDIEEKLAEIAKFIDSEPENAEVTFSPDSSSMFEVKPDVSGKKLDTKKLSAQINSALSAGKSYVSNIFPDEVKAQYTQEMLIRSFNVRKQYFTEFPASSPERKHNIALSLSRFNGMIIPPDTEVSFNKTVGARTEQRGYKTAKIIVGGDFVEGVGGGVCQTSTTLYNAMLLADVKITEQHKHSLAVSYVPPSFDAMVNISSADLKFYNDTGNFLYLKTWCENDRAYVRVYGEKCPYVIERKSTVLKTFETPKEKTVTDTEGKYKNIYEGDRQIVIHSKPKIESIGELVYYKNGKVIKTVTIRKDIYSQLIGTEVIGTAKRPKTADSDRILTNSP